MKQLNHPTFGSLELSDYSNWEGKVTTKEGKSIKISFDFHPLEDTDLAKNAEEHLQQILKNELQYRTQMCNYLFGLAQDWYEAGAENAPEALGLETFIAWTWLDYISFADDGTFSLWFYDDGKIFAGHVIIAEYDGAGAFKGAGIHG